MGIIMDNLRDEALNSVFRALLWEAACFPFFMPKSGVRYAVRYAFRYANGIVQKRNVWIRYAFRYALLTFLKADK